jgi:catecholate siderophore receptor
LEQISVHAGPGGGSRRHPSPLRLTEFTRVEAIVFFRLNDMWRAQLNIENIFDRRHIATADGNRNITSASPRAFRISATANF